MKRRLYVILLIVFVSMITTSCNQLNVDIDDSKSGTDKINYKNDIIEERTVGEKSLELKDYILMINNQPLEKMNYNDVIEHFGEPFETKVEKFRFPGAGPNDYNYFGVLCYEDIEILFYLLEDKLDSIKQTDYTWGFELTGSKYSIGELRVGMSVDNYLEKFGDSKMYLMSNLNKIKSDPYSSGDVVELIHILTSLKPENYYSEYEYVYYEQGSVQSTDYFITIGFALLIKDNKIDKIVIGKR